LARPDYTIHRRISGISLKKEMQRSIVIFKINAGVAIERKITSRFDRNFAGRGLRQNFDVIWRYLVAIFSIIAVFKQIRRYEKHKKPVNIGLNRS